MWTLEKMMFPHQEEKKKVGVKKRKIRRKALDSTFLKGTSDHSIFPLHVIWDIRMFNIDIMYHDTNCQRSTSMFNVGYSLMCHLIMSICQPVALIFIYIRPILSFHLFRFIIRITRSQFFLLYLVQNLRKETCLYSFFHGYITH